MTILTYQAMAQRASSGQGRMIPDSEGYVDIILGAMDCYNSRNEYYAMEGAERLFAGSSIFARRIKNGQLYSELTHPAQENMSRADYFNRLLKIDDKLVSTHIKAVSLDSELWRKNKRTMSPKSIAVIGKIKPYGPYAAATLEAINTPSINLAYSVRSFTKNRTVKGVTVKNMVELVTWDQVGSQGIATANKWDSPGLEVLYDAPLTIGDIKDVAHALHEVGNESMEASVLNLLKYVDDVDSTLEETETTPLQKTPVWARW